MASEKDLMLAPSEIAMTRQPGSAPQGDDLVGEGLISGEASLAYQALVTAGMLTTKYRRADVEAIFVDGDLQANTDHWNDMKLRCMHGVYCLPVIGCMVYNCLRKEFFIPAGNVGLLQNEANEYLFAQPGMHNIQGIFTRHTGTQPIRGHINHGNRTIVIVEQGFIGYAMDNGQPVLLPPGIHVWRSESLYFERSLPLDDHVIKVGPYTILTVDEGYAAVTQNNGKMCIMKGGETHILNHKNWKFEKFMTLKIQTDDLEKIQATSADNIEMQVTSTINWKITDVTVAAINAAETMATSGKAGDVAADITKLRQDVRKQAIASLAAFIGSVNYSSTFHVSAENQRNAHKNEKTSLPQMGVPLAEGVIETKEGEAADQKAVPTAAEATLDNPLFDTDKMVSAVEHANDVTSTFGVEIMSINIISASPLDSTLTRALASGAVASAEALMAETTARGNSRAATILADSDAECSRIGASGKAEADIILANGNAEAETKRAEGAKAAADLLSKNKVAVELTKMDRSASMLRGGEKFFFGESPDMLSNIVLKGAV